MSRRSLLKSPDPSPTRAETKRALAAASGIECDELLDRMLALQIDEKTLATLTLVPLIEVAWADGDLDPAERAVVLGAAKRCGFNRDSYSLLKSWLERPRPELLTAWRDNLAHMLAPMSAERRSAFCSDLFRRAHEVAAATGGVLGIGKISKLERDVLAELELALG